MDDPGNGIWAVRLHAFQGPVLEVNAGMKGVRACRAGAEILLRGFSTGLNAQNSKYKTGSRY